MLFYRMMPTGEAKNMEAAEGVVQRHLFVVTSQNCVVVLIEGFLILSFRTPLIPQRLFENGRFLWVIR